MIATLLVLALVANPPEEPKPPTAPRSVTQPGPSTTARAEATRKKQQRNRLRALNSWRLAGIDGPGSGSFGNSGGFSAGRGNLGSTTFGDGYGGFGGSADSDTILSFELQLASTFRQARSVMAAGQAALEATASLS